jgi:Flp pilus assembly protein TadG
MKGVFVMSSRRRKDEHGQILVLFVLALISMLALVGLVLDGGDTFAQRRNQQNASDLAAMAGANAYLNTYKASPDVATATAAAKAAAVAAATRNGYTNGVGGAAVPDPEVTLLSSGVSVRVSVSAPHVNTFSRVIGFDQWTVSTEATAITGSIDTAVGAAPWTMSIDAFDPDGTPKYDDPNNPTTFGESNGSDYPLSALDFSWTDFNGSNNVNSNEVRNIISGANVVTATFTFGQYLGQHNQGSHTTLYGDVQQYLAGKNVPIPIVGPPDPPATECTAPSPPGHPDGCFKGWAMFHVVSASGGSNKDIVGYFLPDGFQRYPLTVGECTAQQQANNQCGLIDVNYFGAYVVRLVD